MTRYPLGRVFGGTQDCSVQVLKFSLPPGFDPRAVQPVDSHTIEIMCTKRSRYSVNFLAVIMRNIKYKAGNGDINKVPEACSARVNVAGVKHSFVAYVVT
jgi:hypothetical protein